MLWTAWGKTGTSHRAVRTHFPQMDRYRHLSFGAAGVSPWAGLQIGEDSGIPSHSLRHEPGSPWDRGYRRTTALACRFCREFSLSSPGASQDHAGFLPLPVRDRPCLHPRIPERLRRYTCCRLCRCQPGRASPGTAPLASLKTIRPSSPVRLFFQPLPKPATAMLSPSSSRIPKVASAPSGSTTMEGKVK